MGTNFYINYTKKEIALKLLGDHQNPSRHIGKRSAAGLYCYSCGLSLAKLGYFGVHQSDSKWYEECPLCGRGPEKEDLSNSSAGLALSFNKNPYSKKKGVRSCSSFSWAMHKGSIRAKIESFSKTRKPIIDEYGTTYTLRQFLKLVAECPIQFYYNIGVYFS